MKTMKISLWGAICLFLTPNLFFAQSTEVDEHMAKHLASYYGDRISEIHLGWGTDKGDYYLGNGAFPQHLDTTAQSLRRPLLCKVDDHNQLKWVHYLDAEMKYIEPSAWDTANGNLLVGSGSHNHFRFFEFDDDGNWLNHQAIPSDSVAAWAPYLSYSRKKDDFKESIDLHDSWRVVHHYQRATILHEDGTLVWNGELPETYSSHFDFTETPDRKLHGLRIDQETNEVHWLAMNADGEIREAAYGSPRKKWNRGHFLRNKSMTGLYDPNPHRKDQHIFPVEGGKKGYLITATTYNRKKYSYNQRPGHLLQLIDTLGNPIWTRRYSCPAEIVAVSGRIENLRLELEGGNTEELDSLGFYIRYGESLRETHKIKAKTIAKYDQVEREAVQPTHEQKPVIKGQYAADTDILEVSNPKMIAPPPSKYGGRYSSGSNGLSRLGKALRGFADGLKKIGNGIRRRRHRRRFRLFGR